MNKQRKNNLPKSPGRPKGSKNKTTGILKEAILLAAEATGEDGKGKEGLVGYLKEVADKDRKSFCTLLGKVLPLQVEGKLDGDFTVSFKTTYERKPGGV